MEDNENQEKVREGTKGMAPNDSKIRSRGRGQGKDKKRLYSIER